MIDKFVSDCVNLNLSVQDLKEVAKLYFRGKGGINKVREFEASFADYIGVRHAIFISSGRLGLYLILKYLLSLNYNESKREIILSAYNFFAIPYIIKSLGFIPRYLDAEYESCNLDASQIESNISERTAAILVTHAYGNPCFMSKIQELAQRHNLILIEDCAHALGAEYEGRKIGSFGLAGFFSFSLTKILTTFSGGMLVTDQGPLYEYVKEELDSYPNEAYAGASKKVAFGLAANFFSSPAVFNRLTFYLWYLLNTFFVKFKEGLIVEQARPMDIEKFKKKIRPLKAILGLYQIEKIDHIVERQIKNSRILTDALSKLNSLCLTRPSYKDNHKSSFLNFAVKVRDRERIRQALLKLGVDSRKGYLLNCNSLEQGNKDNFVNASRLEQEVLFLPNNNKFDEEEIRVLAERLRCFFQPQG